MFLVEVGCFEAHENGENEASSGTMAPSRLGFFSCCPPANEHLAHVQMIYQLKMAMFIVL